MDQELIRLSRRRAESARLFRKKVRFRASSFFKNKFVLYHSKILNKFVIYLTKIILFSSGNGHPRA